MKRLTTILAMGTLLLPLAAAAAETVEITQGYTATREELTTGEKIYHQACASCHAQGLAGAPKLGDPAAWKERIAQGMQTLIGHAVNGYQGKAGFMPAKGGFTSLSDKEVADAVAYMVKHAR